MSSTTSKKTPTSSTTTTPVVVSSKEDENLPVYTLDEVSKHDKPGDSWTAIGDYVYDISTWIDKHPGGWLIMQGVGRDSSVLFETSHPLYVKSTVLPKYKIGKVKRPEEDFPYNWNSEFYTVLRTRVEKYFKDEKKKSHHGSLELWLQFFITMAGFFVSYYYGFIQGSLWFCFIGPWFYSQIGIMIMHDGNHGATSKSPWVSRFAGMFMDFMGASSFVWKHEHNIGHHQFTNSSLDPDATSGFPILRYNPSQPHRKHHRFQHIYLWIAYFFVGFKWYISDVVYFMKGYYRSMKMYKPSNEESRLLISSKCIALLWGFIIPTYYQGFLWGGFIMPCVSLALTGYCFAMQFVVTHLADDVVFPEEYKKERDWAKCQVLTSSNYAVGSKLATWLSGGLNYQIEHHLFPTISHVYLEEISPIVRKTCKEFDVPYFAHSSYWEALKHHYYHLKRMGVPPEKAVPVDYNKLLAQTEYGRKAE